LNCTQGPYTFTINTAGNSNKHFIFPAGDCIDPSYALPYVGSPTRMLRLACREQLQASSSRKAMLQRKEPLILMRRCELIAELGFTIFLVRWIWNAAENQLKRSRELNPNNADIPVLRAHLLSNTDGTRRLAK